MIVNDRLYGRQKLPGYAEKLIVCREMQRLRGISLDTLPASFLAWNVPSRLEHCIGVCIVMQCVIQENPRLSEKIKKLLLVAALLHDAGNPPFCHLSEPFLKEFSGHDGESHLESLFRGTSAERILEEIGLSLEEVANVVTGNAHPISAVLNGSMDADNLDNILRYWFAATNERPYDALLIASSFCYSAEEKEWTLDGRCKEHVLSWQKARVKVYGKIYGEPHLNACMMLWRAIYFAFYSSKITENFFRMSDWDALDFLRGCGSCSKLLISRLREGRLHREVVSIETSDPSPLFISLSKEWNARGKLADSFADDFRVIPELVSAYIGKGRDRRSITLPFVGGDGTKSFLANELDTPIYRAKIYMDPRAMCSSHDAMTWLEEYLKS